MKNFLESDNTNRIAHYAEIGANVVGEGNIKIEPFSVLRDNIQLGSNVWIKEFVAIYSGAKIGSDVKIRAYSVICEDAVIRDKVEFGCAVHLVDHVRMCAFNNKQKDEVRPPTIDYGARIGGRTTIQAGVKIGKNAIILPHSQVRDDVPDEEIWGGNPARLIKDIHGELRIE